MCNTYRNGIIGGKLVVSAYGETLAGFQILTAGQQHQDVGVICNDTFVSVTAQLAH